jgi:hypothetical protein
MEYVEEDLSHCKGDVNAAFIVNLITTCEEGSDYQETAENLHTATQRLLQGLSPQQIMHAPKIMRAYGKVSAESETAEKLARATCNTFSGITLRFTGEDVISLMRKYQDESEYQESADNLSSAVRQTLASMDAESRLYEITDLIKFYNRESEDSESAGSLAAATARTVKYARDNGVSIISITEHLAAARKHASEEFRSRKKDEWNEIGALQSKTMRGLRYATTWWKQRNAQEPVYNATLLCEMLLKIPK